MIKNSLMNGVVFLVMLGSMSQYGLASAEEFTSSELKQIRFLSKALIKSRANEKIKIDKEMEPERKRVQIMQDALQALEMAQLNNMKNIELEAVAPVITITDFKINSPTSTGMAQNTISINMPQVQSLVSKELRSNGTKSVSIALAKLASERAELEGEQPSRLKFWKKKNIHDKRNDHLIKISKEVEEELQLMKTTDVMSLEKIASLKERLMLKKPELAVEEIQPTFQTITKHRK